MNQWVEWSWLLSLNVIKPIQPSKTQAHTPVAALSPNTHPAQVQNPEQRPHTSMFRSSLMMCSPCFWLVMYAAVAESCPLLWYQWLAVLQTSSKRTCQWSSYADKPRAAASHDPLLSWVRVTSWKPCNGPKECWKFLISLSFMNEAQWCQATLGATLRAQWFSKIWFALSPFMHANNKTMEMEERHAHAVWHTFY